MVTWKLLISSSLQLNRDQHDVRGPKRPESPISLYHEGRGTPGLLLWYHPERKTPSPNASCVSRDVPGALDPHESFYLKVQPGEDAHFTLCLTFRVPASPVRRRRCRCACPSDLVPSGGLELEAQAGAGGTAPAAPRPSPQAAARAPAARPAPGGAAAEGREHLPRELLLQLPQALPGGLHVPQELRYFVVLGFAQLHASHRPPAAGAPSGAAVRGGERQEAQRHRGSWRPRGALPEQSAESTAPHRTAPCRAAACRCCRRRPQPRPAARGGAAGPGPAGPEVGGRKAAAIPRPPLGSAQPPGRQGSAPSPGPGPGPSTV